MIATLRSRRHLGRFVPGLSPQQRRLRRSTSESILIAEHRDEVFARLAGDLKDMGYKVYRAASADQVPRFCRYASAGLVICSMGLPDASAWLIAARLRLCRAGARLWAYSPWPSERDRHWAAFSRIDRVLYYHGDVFRLSHQIKSGLSATSLRFGHSL